MNKDNFKILFGSLILLSLVMSCASFPKNEFPSISYINRSNISLLEGNYCMKHFNTAYYNDSILHKSVSKEDLNKYPTLFHEINNGLLVRRLKLDSEKAHTFSLKILNPKRIEIDYIEDDLIIRKNSIRYRLKDDGFVYIKHRNFKIIGIPYILGGINQKRNRLALNVDYNLLFETSEFRSGGVFYPGFMVPVINFGSTSKYRKIYKRIDELNNDNE
ncbi:hypothetical protein NO995_16075 [Aestuariibaculum sp. M13]|uniref:hypothetical protein n=1 Tax=Aestuariibaculum sp. M13 TaxID=2967132 RepID=UPI00215A0378|nr:hypothetical protein [Aestuariibaculum sp. M13]MCR8669205.1 hypothetical protein [Aestuariibaculum sp. M13]